MKRDPDNYLLFERDGSFNPTWLFVGAYNLVGVVAGGMAFWLAWRLEHALLAGAALSFVSLNIVVHLISALPQNKAKILAESRVLEAAMRGGAVFEGRERDPGDVRG